MTKITEFYSDVDQHINSDNVVNVNNGLDWEYVRFSNTNIFTVDTNDNTRINISESGFYKASYNVHFNKTGGNTEFNVVQTVPSLYHGIAKNTFKQGTAFTPIVKINVTQSTATAIFLFEAEAGDQLAIDAVVLFDDDHTENIKSLGNFNTLIIEKIE